VAHTVQSGYSQHREHQQSYLTSTPANIGISDRLQMYHLGI